MAHSRVHVAVHVNDHVNGSLLTTGVVSVNGDVVAAARTSTHAAGAGL